MPLCADTCLAYTYGQTDTAGIPNIQCYQGHAVARFVAFQSGRGWMRSVSGLQVRPLRPTIAGGRTSQWLGSTGLSELIAVLPVALWYVICYFQTRISEAGCRYVMMRQVLATRPHGHSYPEMTPTTSNCSVYATLYEVIMMLSTTGLDYTCASASDIVTTCFCLTSVKYLQYFPQIALYIPT